MTDELLKLKTETERVFGRKITTATDCEALSNQIFSITEIRLSAQTVRRLWQIIKNTNKPSVHSLNTLSQYIGYRDYAAFKLNINNQPSKPVYDFELIKLIFQKNNTQFGKYEIWTESMVGLIAEQIMSNQNLFESFVEHLGGNEGAVRYIIGGYQCYDLLDTDWYVRGFRTCCYKSKELHHRLYYETMMYVSCILRNKQQDGRSNINRIKELWPKMRTQYGFVFPLEGPIYGCLIAHALFEGQHQKALLLFKEAKYIPIQHKHNSFVDLIATSYRSFITNLIEILVHVDCYEWAADLIETYGFEDDALGFWRETKKVYMAINEALIYFNTNNKKAAQVIFESIILAPKFYRFDRRNIITLYYLLLKLGLTPKTSKIKRAKLVDEIGLLSDKSNMLIFKKKANLF